MHNGENIGRIGLLLVVGVLTSDAQWVPTAGPTLMEGVHLFCTVSKGDTLIAGAYRKGIFFSDNNGTTWRSFNTGLPQPYYTYADVYDVLLEGGITFAATSSGVFFSNDFVSWEERNDGIPDYADCMALLRVGNDLLVGTTSGVFRSTNDGISWDSSSQGLPTSPFGCETETFHTKDGYVFAGTYDGVYRSSDDGHTWEESNNGIPLYSQCCHPRIGGFVTVGSNLFAATINGGGVYRSTNNGESWTVVSIGLPINQFTGNVVAIWALTGNGGTLYAGVDAIGPYPSIFSSTNLGEDWVSENNGPTNGFVHSLNTANGHVVASMSTGIHRLTNSTWEPVLTHFPDPVYVTAMTATHSGFLVAGFGESGASRVFRSDDLGESYETVLTNTYVSSFASLQSKLLAGGSTVLVSTNEGLSWDSAGSGLPQHPSITDLCVVDTTLFAGSGIYSGQSEDGRVYKSSDQGEEWFSSGLEGLYVGTVGGDGYAVFAGVRAFFSCGGTYRSLDMGATWDQVTVGLPDCFSPVAIIAGTSTLILGGGSGLSYTSDHGESWTPHIPSLPPGTYLRCLLKRENVILAGTNAGVFLSEGIGTPWVQMNEGLSIIAKEINVLAVHDDHLFAGTYEGVWRRPLSEIVLTVKAFPIPIEFAVLQNYPNPFNPTTNIKFQIPNSNFVSLEVFNVLGQKVRTLVNEKREAGEHTVSFDAAGLPSGVYVYRLTAGGFSQARKLVLLR